MECNRTEISQATCEVCLLEKVCLRADNSRWEYLPVVLCLDCIKTLFKKFTESDSNYE